MKSTNTNLGAPIWMHEEEDEEINLSRNQSNHTNPEQGISTQGNCSYKRIIYISFRAIAIVLSILMAATAALGLSMISGVDESGRIFVAIYMFFFAALLFIFELNQIRQIESIDHMFKRNFGFMFNTSGHALFIIL